MYFIPDVPLPILFFLSSPPLLFCSLVPGEKLGLDDALQVKSFFDKTAYEFPTIAEIEEYDINMLLQRPGDVVIVPPGVPHTVISLTTTVAEASNFMYLPSLGHQWVHTFSEYLAVHAALGRHSTQWLLTTKRILDMCGKRGRLVWAISEIGPPSNIVYLIRASTTNVHVLLGWRNGLYLASGESTAFGTLTPPAQAELHLASGSTIPHGAIIIEVRIISHVQNSFASCIFQLVYDLVDT